MSSVNNLFPIGSMRRDAAKGILSIIVFLFGPLLSLIRGFRHRLYIYKIRSNYYSENIMRIERDIGGAEEYAQRLGTQKNKPLISIIMPVYNTDETYLREAIDSVLKQYYGEWELCICDDGSAAPHIKQILQEAEKSDKRIKVHYSEENENISLASNRALDLAKGEFIALLDHDDLLSPRALAEMVLLINKEENVDIIYSDEDKLGYDGIRCEPFFKPDWSPELLLSVNYFCHLTVIRKELIEDAGRFRKGYEGSQDYDLFLRCSAKAQNIQHIPAVLYHWRKTSTSTADTVDAKSYASEAGRKALEDYLSNQGQEGTVEITSSTNYRVKFGIKDEPCVSIIIPFKDKPSLLRQCVSSIREKSTYKNYEIILINNLSEKEETHSYLKEVGNNENVRVIDYESSFNYSKINNFAAKQAKGNFLLFLNNDIKVISPDWIESLLGLCQNSDIGAVGAKLLFEDGTIQHAGVVVGMIAFAGHVFASCRDEFLYFGTPNWMRNYLAVTAACLMVQKDDFDSVGGFNENMIVCGSDVSLCLDLVKIGRRNVYTPFAQLYHLESQSRDSYIPPQDFIYSYDAYKPYLDGGDPYYNPNLSLEKTNCDLMREGEKDHMKELVKVQLADARKQLP